MPWCLGNICNMNCASYSNPRLLLQVEQEDNESEDGGDVSLDPDAGPSSEAAPKGPASPKPAAKSAVEKTPKQGQAAENGAAGEGRVQGTGKRGGLTETEGRATGPEPPT